MSYISIETPRLELIAGTVDIVRADIGHHDELARLLDAVVPSGWPPELIDLQAREFWLNQLEANPQQVGWWCWYLVRRQASAPHRTLIGGAGFYGPPAEDGVVTIGYSAMPQFQNQGYVSEAIDALLGWAFGHEQTSKAIAETFPQLKPSIRVLEKNGFAFVGAGSEEGTVRYQLDRAGYLAGHTNR